jgi:hypothetical protein
MIDVRYSMIVSGNISAQLSLSASRITVILAGSGYGFTSLHVTSVHLSIY